MEFLETFLQGKVDQVDRYVFGRRPLRGPMLDMRTLMCVILAMTMLFTGLSITGFWQSRIADFAVWMVVGIPLIFVFLARKQRRENLEETQVCKLRSYEARRDHG